MKWLTHFPKDWLYLLLRSSLALSGVTLRASTMDHTTGNVMVSPSAGSILLTSRGSVYRELWSRVSSGHRWKPDGDGSCPRLLLGSCVLRAPGWSKGAEVVVLPLFSCVSTLLKTCFQLQKQAEVTVSFRAGCQCSSLVLFCHLLLHGYLISFCSVESAQKVLVKNISSSKLTNTEGIQTRYYRRNC